MWWLPNTQYTDYTYRTLCPAGEGWCSAIHPSNKFDVIAAGFVLGVFYSVIATNLLFSAYIMACVGPSSIPTYLKAWNFATNSSFVRAFPFDHLNTVTALQVNQQWTHPRDWRMSCPVAPKTASCSLSKLVGLGPPQQSISWMHAWLPQIDTSFTVIPWHAWVWRSLNTEYFTQFNKRNLYLTTAQHAVSYSVAQPAYI